MSIIGFERKSWAISRWVEFTGDIIDDTSASPKDIVQLIEEMEDFIEMLKEQEDVKELL